METKTTLGMIAKTGFYTSAASYVIFWLADALRPGFVARYLSVHVFLAAAVVFGAVWLWSDQSTSKEKLVFEYLLAVGLGILLSVVSWNLGEGFEQYRVLVALIGLAAPMLCLILVRNS